MDPNTGFAKILAFLEAQKAKQTQEQAQEQENAQPEAEYCPCSPAIDAIADDVDVPEVDLNASYMPTSPPFSASPTPYPLPPPVELPPMELPTVSANLVSCLRRLSNIANTETHTDSRNDHRSRDPRLRHSAGRRDHRRRARSRSPRKPPVRRHRRSPPRRPFRTLSPPPPPGEPPAAATFSWVMDPMELLSCWDARLVMPRANLMELLERFAAKNNGCIFLDAVLLRLAPEFALPAPILTSVEQSIRQQVEYAIDHVSSVNPRAPLFRWKETPFDTTKKYEGYQPGVAALQVKWGRRAATKVVISCVESPLPCAQLLQSYINQIGFVVAHVAPEDLPTLSSALFSNSDVTNLFLSGSNHPVLENFSNPLELRKATQLLRRHVQTEGLAAVLGRFKKDNTSLSLAGYLRWVQGKSRSLVEECLPLDLAKLELAETQVVITTLSVLSISDAAQKRKTVKPARRRKVS